MSTYNQSCNLTKSTTTKVTTAAAMMLHQTRQRRSKHSTAAFQLISLSPETAHANAIKASLTTTTFMRLCINNAILQSWSEYLLFYDANVSARQQQKKKFSKCKLTHGRGMCSGPSSLDISVVSITNSIFRGISSKGEMPSYSSNFDAMQVFNIQPFLDDIVTNGVDTQCTAYHWK